MEPGNEFGIAPPRGRPRGSKTDTEALLSKSLGKETRLPTDAVVTRPPETCPACGSSNVIWGCDPEQERTREEIHALVWDRIGWMADSFICRDCNAGWIEPDDPETITWVRPYWIV
jgi:hypothetical protein